LYKEEVKVGRHYYNNAGEPMFIVYDAHGAEEGRLQAKTNIRATRDRQANDGGYGSVDSELLISQNGTGTGLDCIVHDALTLALTRRFSS
jgi:hypothetical protein